jgi:hypothetical protein
MVSGGIIRASRHLSQDWELTERSAASTLIGGLRYRNERKDYRARAFCDVFADKTTLLPYSFMFGPNWDKPLSMHVARR